MLDLRPNCELCDKDLPPGSSEAMICTYECTFCATCVESVLKDVCPNCGGNFCPRPIRPTNEHRKGVSLSIQPASKQRVNTKYSNNDIAGFVNPLSGIEPELR